MLAVETGHKAKKPINTGLTLLHLKFINLPQERLEQLARIRSSPLLKLPQCLFSRPRLSVESLNLFVLNLENLRQLNERGEIQAWRYLPRGDTVHGRSGAS